MKFKQHIPNIITCCNLLSGATATVFALNDSFEMAFLLIVLGAVFDFFDGMSARLLKVSSPIGKELDSLADDITFGLAPALMLYAFLRPVIGWWALLVLLMAAFSALRLAKFNLDERQTTSFRGLATPANALFWASLVCFANQNGLTDQWVCIVMVVMSLMSCYLLVCDMPMFSLKFHNLKFKENCIRYVFVCTAVLIVVISALLSQIWLAGSMIILLYIVLSLVDMYVKAAN